MSLSGSQSLRSSGTGLQLVLRSTYMQNGPTCRWAADRVGVCLYRMMTPKDSGKAVQHIYTKSNMGPCPTKDRTGLRLCACSTAASYPRTLPLVETKHVHTSSQDLELQRRHCHLRRVHRRQTQALPDTGTRFQHVLSCLGRYFSRCSTTGRSMHGKSSVTMVTQPDDATQGV